MKDWKVIAALFIGGTLLTIARRWNNDDKDAGSGVAMSTVILVAFYL